MDVIMKQEMTYSELDEIKNNIKDFIFEIENVSKKYNFDFKESDRSFFSFIAKHIIFMKYLHNKKDIYYNVLISDFYYLILSIIRSEIRYMYVNERSIIENYMRLVMMISVEDNHITKAVFEQMKEFMNNQKFADSCFSLIRAEYRDACEYIHGGEVLSNSLAYVFDECERQVGILKNRNKYYERFESVIKTFDRLIVIRKVEYVDECFHRRKTILKYLIGEGQVDLLFELIE